MVAKTPQSKEMSAEKSHKGEGEMDTNFIQHRNRLMRSIPSGVCQGMFQTITTLLLFTITHPFKSIPFSGL